jgi:putative 4-mercaptohistidine N1-methyltranferase
MSTEKEQKQTENIYELTSTLQMYNEFHYGPPHLGFPNFSKSVADVVVEFSVGYKRGRVMDLGCAVGRCAFELAKVFDAVVGVDYSASFIRTAQQIQKDGVIHFASPIEGDLVESRSVTLSELGLDTGKDKCEFAEGDACNLDPIFTNFDVVVCVNLIDRLSNPYLFLEMIHNRIHIGGLLFITSPYTWLEQFTPKEKWVGGYIDSKGKPVTTLDGLKNNLQPHFRLLREPLDVTMIIRETARKYQHTLVQLTVWERVASEK